MKQSLFKFCSADSAAAILEHEQIFVTSPLDLNDPFEMRPGWTAEHEERQHQNELKRSELTAGIPMFAAMKDGPVYVGPMAPVEAHPPIDVESQRGMADGLNERAFEILHQRFRVLSLVSQLFLRSTDQDSLPDDSESGEEATLMWSHYGEQFQGVCLVLNPAAFNNGIQAGGYLVQYPPERRSLPATFYDSFLSLGRSQTQIKSTSFTSHLLTSSHSSRLVGRTKTKSVCSTTWPSSSILPLIDELTLLALNVVPAA